jgi:hypothetical protein
MTEADTLKVGGKDMGGIDRTMLWLRVEGMAIFIAAIAAYAWSGGNWILFAVLLLAPDLFMLGYLQGPRIGAFVYNLGHVYAAPIALGALGMVFGINEALPVALIWIAHIGMDRMLGYGLKRPSGFKHTHLGKL